MTDTRQLLAEYARNGSEAAFRELVTRYLDPVYSAAVRLVDGDTHRAQDVAQTVFADLARMADVLVLKVRTSNAPGLKPPVNGGQKDYTAHSTSGGEFVCNNRPLSTDTEPLTGLQRFLENEFKMPVVDETGLTGNFSIDLKWNETGPNHEGLEQALANQLGLELVPGQRAIEMLVVQRAN